jgi:hypothetical protein
MASDFHELEVLQAAVAAIPRVAERIAAIPIEERATAFDAAERAYLRAAQDLLCPDEPARNWVSAVMRSLRSHVAEQEMATEKLTALLHELNEAE